MQINWATLLIGVLVIDFIHLGWFGKPLKEKALKTVLLKPTNMCDAKYLHISQENEIYEPISE